MNASERFIYKPRYKHEEDTIHLYDGEPCPSVELLETINQDGVDAIHAMMQEMLEVRKKMFGCAKEEFYGFNDSELFYDLETLTGIQLFANAKTALKNNPSEEFSKPELLTDKNYMILKIDTPFLGKELGKRAFKNRVLRQQQGLILGYQTIPKEVKKMKKSADFIKSVTKGVGDTEYRALLKDLIDTVNRNL